MKRKHRVIHPSWLIAACSLAITAGIALAVIGALPTFPVWQGLLVLGALLFIAFTRRTAPMIVLVVVAGVTIGLWRGSAEQQSLRAYTPLRGKVVTLSGTVNDDTSYGPHGDQRIMLADIAYGTQHLGGQIWVSTDSQAAVKRSDHLTVQGKLGDGFGGIAASIFHARIVHLTPPASPDVGLTVRDWFSNGIRIAIPEPQASLAAGYLVGQRSALPEDLDQQLKTVGLTHAVVASGYNLTILVAFARRLLLGVSKYLATLSAAGMIACFMMISGLSPSMSRAGLVTGLSLAAWYYGRRIHPVVLLAFTCAITALLRPEYVWGDIGWYLSFTSFTGVILLAPLAKHYFWGNKKLSFVHELVLDTMSAQVATLPIMIFAFGHYSPYALLANILVLPLIPLTMALTFLAGISGILLPAAAHWAGLPATVVLQYMTTVVSHIANLPGAQGDLIISAAMLTASYGALATVLAILWHATKHNFRRNAPEEVNSE